MSTTTTPPAPQSVTDQVSQYFSNLDAQTASLAKPQSFKASSIEVTYDLELPISITIPGSRVKYAFGTEGGDISFGLFIQPPGAAKNSKNNEEDDTELLEITRVASDKDPITGTITIPAACTLLFYFDNHYSWFKAKKLSYSVSLLPPSEEQIKKLRGERFKDIRSKFVADKEKGEARLTALTDATGKLTKKVEELSRQLKEASTHLAVTTKEEKALNDKIAIRNAQIKGLDERLV